MSTPHNRAEKGQIAGTVLMPGDPVRARWIADTYLDQAVLVSDVRNVYCYTGQYKGHPVSVMASGMGMPSIGIYSYELYSVYDVEAIIRIGSAGAYRPEVGLGDVVLAESAYTESSFALAQCGRASAYGRPSEKLNRVIQEAAEGAGRKLTVGAIHSSDVFYHQPEADAAVREAIERDRLLCVEMESFALFHNAGVLGREAACLLTISDSFVTDEHMSADDRATAFSSMVEIALEAAIRR